jgi:hypothetical protein
VAPAFHGRDDPPRRECLLPQPVCAADQTDRVFMAEKTTKNGRGNPSTRPIKRPVSISGPDDNLLESIDQLAAANVRSRSTQIEYMLRKYLAAERKLAGLAD